MPLYDFFADELYSQAPLAVQFALRRLAALPLIDLHLAELGAEGMDEVRFDRLVVVGDLGLPPETGGPPA